MESSSFVFTDTIDARLTTPFSGSTAAALGLSFRLSGPAGPLLGAKNHQGLWAGIRTSNEGGEQGMRMDGALIVPQRQRTAKAFSLGILRTRPEAGQPGETRPLSTFDHLRPLKAVVQMHLSNTTALL